MRNIAYIVFVLIALPMSLFGQLGEVFLHVKLDTFHQELKVKQVFKLRKESKFESDEMYFHAWANAYSGKLTPLNFTKLEDRKGALHFSQKEERGGLADLKLTDSNGNLLDFQIKEREFVRVQLPQVWKSNQEITIHATYRIKVPLDVFTRYGRSKEGDYLLKYFFLTPAIQTEAGEFRLQHYKDFEELSAPPMDYKVSWEVPQGIFIFSDLEGENQFWSGKNREHFRFYLTPNSKKFEKKYVLNPSFEVDFGFEMDSIQRVKIDSLLPSQLQFLHQHLGNLPEPKLFLSAKTKKEQDFFGVDDLDAWIMTIKLFTEVEKQALKLFQILSYEYIDRLFITYKNEDHWLKNGLQFYLMMKYVDQNFPDLKLLGHVPEEFKILGMKPLKFFHASKVKMNDRYKLLYLFLARQNYDQPINTSFEELSNLNQFAISGFKTGLTFYYIDQYLGGNQFDEFIKEFVETHRCGFVSQKEFQHYLIQNSGKDLNWFFEDYINRKDKINFKILTTQEESDSVKIRIKNTTQFQGPFKVVGYKEGNIQEEKWYRNSEKYFEVNFPKGDYDKIELNPGYLFPEFNDRDNYLRTTGLFKNSKKIQLKLYSDIENPEYAQIFMNPQIRWNNYDKFLIGIRFHNQSLLTRPFKWNLSPKYSTGTGRLAGSGGISHTFMPQWSIFRSITLGGVFRYEHYDRDLTYRKWSLYSTVYFKKQPRETLSQGFLVSYDHLNKEVPEFSVQTDEDLYGLWNLTYFYSKPDYIHESHGSVTLQTTKTFQKIIGEIYYRWRFTPKKQLGFRLFAGSFLINESDSDYFNFGVSHVSDYAFNMNLLGRSESSGILSQQFVLAEAGFKSNFDFTVNQWLISTNLEIPVWKMFDLYADAGVYKNKLQSAKFIYDSGIRFKIIPDFLEIYLPVQSSLGFEPGESNYWEKIRFTFNFNLTSIINYLRRGWY